MAPWVPAKDFIEADLIRWNEGVFDRRRRGKDALRIGERVVVAEVLKIDADDWVRLLIRACTTSLDDIVGKYAPNLKLEAEIRRAKKTILRGKPVRLQWSEESVREAVAVERLNPCQDPA
jgi:hypothetical protein